jgi:putative ABC transport system permease protein
MTAILQDVRYGFRMLLKSPGFTVVAVVALALGIGANTAIFSVINSVLLRPLPYADPDRLVVVWETNPNLGGNLQLRNEASPANYLDWKAQQTVFEDFGVFNWNTFNLTGGDTPEQLTGNPSTASIFSTLGVKPMLGRVISAEDDREGAPRVVLLSHKLWQRRFGAKPEIVGQQISLNNQSYTVIGVMPPEFVFPAGISELWVPMAFTKAASERRSAHYLYTRARLKPGVSMEQAQAEMDTIAARLRQQYPDTNTDRGIRLVSLHEETVRQLKPALLVLLGAVGFVLLIACANVANLMLARATARHKEIAIRTALGASRWRVVRQLLTESLLLSLAGGLCGLLLALWGIDLLKGGVPSQMISFTYGWNQIGLDARVLTFTLAISILTGMLFGLIPALQVSKPDLNEGLKEGDRGSTGTRNRARSLLVVSEVALALILLVGAGLMMKSFVRLLEVRPGFDPENVLTASLSLPRARYDNTQKAADFVAQLEQQVAGQPGVKAVGAVNLLPMAGSGATTSFVVEGQAAPMRGQEPEANYRVVTPSYFGALGIPVARGRAFNEHDRAKEAGAPGVAIINETMVRLFFQNEDPLGRRLLDSEGRNPPVEIVGVVGDIKHFGLDDKPEAYLYLPHAQVGGNFMTLVVRTERDPSAMTAALRREVLTLDKDQPVFDVKTMEQRLADTGAQKRLTMWLLGVMASVALVLAAVGIYGVIAYSVTQRTHEIGIRMALGAQRGDIIRLVVKQGMLMAVVGVLVGLAASFYVTRVMSGLLFGVSATDPATFAGVALLLAAVALVACLIPARRATRVDPMVALRYE